MLNSYDLRTEYLINPMGMDEPCPRFSWKLRGSGSFQRKCRIVVRAEDGSCVWDTGLTDSEQNLQVEYGGEPLKPFTRYTWSVSVQDDLGEDSVAPGGAWFETGFLGTPWTAKWVCGAPSGSESMRPVRRIFKKFSLPNGVKKARLYLTALGICTAQLNGKPTAADDWFLPGWTDYRHRVPYGAFDILPLLKKGDNMLSFDLADGWFNGRIARWRNGGRDAYGPHTLLKAEIRLEQEDGTVQILASDSSFRAMLDPGPIKYSDFYSGEMFDASVDDIRWRMPDSPFVKIPDSNGEDFSPVYDNHTIACGVEESPAEIIWRRKPGIGHLGTLQPVSVVHTDAGTWLLDFGKDVAGRERITLKNTRAGAVVTVRHGEWLNPDGTLYTANYRSADAMTTYLCGGKTTEVYEPHYTWYGFRYIEISGLPGELMPGQVTAEIYGEPLAEAGSFSCSNELLNRWSDCVRQTFKNDAFEVPMDCHQRDERLGWTGDGQLFMNVGTYLCNGAAFYTKWLYDIVYSANCQPNGCFSIIAPYFDDGGIFSAVWSDAGITIPVNMYRKYGDIRLLRFSYDRMAHWIDYQSEKCQVKPGIVNSSRYRDWLYLGLDTSKELVATASWYWMHLLMIKTAHLLGKESDEKRWKERAEQIRAAFLAEFFDGEGNIKEASQTAAVLALHYGLVDDRTREKTLKSLLKNIHETNHDHIVSGLVGTPLILKTLSQYGEAETAYDLLLQTSAPGWLNEVILGATTVWEHWDSFDPKTGFMDPAMNSFSHCALGAAGDWLYEGIGGILPEEPAFRTFRLSPCFTDRLEFAQVGFESEYGTIRSAWKHVPGGIEWEVSVPKNTRAHIELPEQVKTLEPGEYSFFIERKGK